ncbi:MAG: TRAP transporter substrate-binding protein DctP [Elusimicrobiota bacterium]|jgi:TRAP-type C4-dicarboxylate transport system substrate-binding protein
MKSFKIKTIFYFFAISIILNISLYSQTVIKFATLAPEGTTWTKILREFAKDAETKTNGRVKFKIYVGGVQGDEKDVIRKIKTGQLNASGFTGFGIGEIAKEMRVLDAPFLFKNTAELDHIYRTFDKDFRKIFEKNGFILLGWSEIGDVYVLSKNEIKKTADFKKSKLWVWEGDPIALKTFEKYGTKPIPLSIADVMTSIQTGMIDTVYATPATIIPLGWYNKMNYILDMPITYASGAVLISKETFDKLSEEDKKIIMDLSDKYFSNLNKLAREDNKKGIELLKSKLKVSKPQNQNEFKELSIQARKELTSVYGAEMLEKIEKELSNFRNAKTKTNKN